MLNAELLGKTTLNGNILSKPNLSGELQSETIFIRDFEYPELTDKPQINGIELVGNKTHEELGIIIPKKTSEFQNDGDGISPFATEEYTKENGGKIDEIYVNGVKQEIVNKAVYMAVITENEVDNKISDYVQLASKEEIDAIFTGEV